MVFYGCGNAGGVPGAVVVWGMEEWVGGWSSSLSLVMVKTFQVGGVCKNIIEERRNGE